MKTLDKIGCEQGTDRASNGWHDYLGIYAKFLYDRRDLPINLLEMGVLRGAGLRMWSEYLTHPAARIHGIDSDLVDVTMPDDRRVTASRGSQSDEAFLKTLPCQVWDVVIDDAGHVARHQITSFALMWPRVAPGGLYFLEDLHSAFAPSLNEPGVPTIMQWLYSVLADMQDHRGVYGLAKRDAADMWDTIDTVTVRKGMAIFRKQTT